MVKPYQVQESRADWIIGFTIPLGIFVEAGSPIVLATSEIGQDGLFIPLSLILLPFAMVLRVVRGGGGQQTYPWLLTYASISFSAYAMVMSAVSALTINTIAILYGLQWALTFAWLPYFSTLYDPKRFSAFLRGFVLGVLVNVGYYSLSGLIEIAFYGGLQDAGRLSQNLILVGQYQVATYLPTLIVYSALIVISLKHYGVIEVGKIIYISIVSLSLLALIFLASRESVLVLLSFIVLLGLLRGGAARAASIAAFVLLGLALMNMGALTEAFRASDFRLLNKLANLAVEGKALAGRDVMIADVVQIIRHDPIFGTYFLPPNSGINNLRVEAPSAHNMYLDVFAWSGLLGGILFSLAIISLLGVSLKNVLASRRASASGRAALNITLLLIVFLFISNNINVPMRQPLIVPMFSLLAFICSRYAKLA